MRRDFRHIFPLTSMLLLFFSVAYGQSWSNVLVPSRAINWSGAGLPATLPDGETTPNPWTPPTRTQCTAYSGYPSAIRGTGTASIDAPALNNALVACSGSKGYIPITGTFNLGGTTSGAGSCYGGTTYYCIEFYAVNGVTLRGSGPQSTFINLTGGAFIAFGGGYGSGSCSWTAGYARGTTSITVSGCSGPALAAGNVVSLTQCDSGFSGAGCTTGAAADNGWIYVCGLNVTCDRAGEGTGNNPEQQQNVLVTSVSGSTVTFTPGIYMPNWVSGQTPTISWQHSSTGGTPYGNGLEDLTVSTANASSTTNYSVSLDHNYASWIKGVRFLGSAVSTPLALTSDKNSLVINNYFFGDVILDAKYPPAMQEGGDSDDLVINNLMTSGVPWEGTGSAEGNVVAYNYTRDTFTAYVLDMFQHNGGSAFMMYEGNQTGSFEDDDTHGTHDLNTWFRNYVSGWDGPYTTFNPAGITWDSYARFENAVGNSIGSSQLTNYQSTWSNRLPGFVFSLDSTSSAHSDPLVEATALRWGNCDTVTGSCRFQSSEIPASLTGNASPFQNPVPSSQALPCSFFLSGYSSNSCTPTYNGGTGLSFWKVCTNWATFPTNCSGTQTQPFPIAGPDITGGPYVNGRAYDIPAAIAFKSLPVDPNYQKAYSITGSLWANGIETLTVSGLPNTTHLLGGFQISGGACTGGEFFMTGSTSATVSYALASNPGNCAGGTFKFPDVRQFDERVYQADSSSGAESAPTPPSGLAAVAQ